jgi:arabinogalactan endo-1,4-beta-galactosidase
MMTALAKIMLTFPNGHGLGWMYWVATRTAVPGNGWEPERVTFGNNWEDQDMLYFDEEAMSSMWEFSMYANQHK